MRVKYLFLFIFIQLIIIGLLGYKIYYKSNNTLGATYIYPINKNDIVYNSNNNLKYFYEPKPNTTESTPDWLPLHAKYSINEDSLNERFNYSLKKSDDTFRIITIGDSFTYGIGVDTKDNWSEKLEDSLNALQSCITKKYEVINLGVGGYDLEYEVERFKIRGSKYKPNLVIWFLVDFERIDEKLLPLNNKFLNDYLKNGDFEKQVKENRFYESFKKAREKVIDNMGESNISKYQEKVIKSFSNYYSGKLILVIPPWFKEEQKKIFKDYALSRADIYIEFEDFKTFRKENQLADTHPNQKGHQIIADNLVNYLKQNRIIPCD